ncbi:host cell division inhibitor Icd-like protein [Citrobacter freundii]|nr:host cell division inhibitor Icd-like protein [Citrobacter freundii]MEB0335752.1 host cell division inhibitor Icd-like protein [Citrobacter freundii]HED6947801.1 host cell division inhibitor Icd-like protein [Citrobacter freundii]
MNIQKSQFSSEAAPHHEEARRLLARDNVCFFAGRIRTGGAHA